MTANLQLIAVFSYFCGSIRLKKMRLDVKQLVADYNRTEDDLKAIQSVGMLIGDVLKRMDDDRFIVKASSGPRYVVGCRTKLDKSKLTTGTRVALDMTTLTIMRPMPREVGTISSLAALASRLTCASHRWTRRSSTCCTKTPPVSISAKSVV